MRHHIKQVISNKGQTWHYITLNGNTEQTVNIIKWYYNYSRVISNETDNWTTRTTQNSYKPTTIVRRKGKYYSKEVKN